MSPSGSPEGDFPVGVGAVLAVPAATEGPKEPGTTGVDALPVAAAEGDVGLVGLAGFAGFSGGIAGALFAVTLGVTVDAGAAAFVGDAVGPVGAAPGNAGGVGFAGFLPCNALLGSQSLFFFDSVASDSLV